MKYKKKISKAYKFLGLIVILIFIIIILRFVLGSVFYESRNYEIDTPAQNISANIPLIASVDFNNEIEVRGAIEKFIKSIDNAKHTIEIAVFSINSDRIRKALINADKRGVKVTLILDSSRIDQHDLFIEKAPKSIIRIDGGVFDAVESTNSYYMHHKFMIVDRGFDNQELTAGSLNFTDIGEKYNESFFITTNDASMISVYGKEFDLLKKRQFGVNKLKNKEYDPWSARIQYTNGFVEVWMSPGYSTRSVKYRILQLINSATSSIDIMMWYFTDEEIAQALVKKSGEGVNIKIIVEDTNATSTASVIPFLLAERKVKNLSNMEIILDTKSSALIKEKVPDGFNPYFHQHTMIVDKKIVVFGTNNWGAWGFYHNDEDIMITDNAYIVSQFDKTLDFFYKSLK